MNRSKFTLAAVVVGLGMAFVAGSGNAFDGEASRSGSLQVEHAAPKGDLQLPDGCLGHHWPDIPARCLTSKAGQSVRQVRTITTGYAAGDAITVLVRMPAPQVASR